MISWASLGVSHVFLENIEKLNEDRQDIITVLPYNKYGKKHSGCPTINCKNPN